MAGVVEAPSDGWGLALRLPDGASGRVKSSCQLGELIQGHSKGQKHTRQTCRRSFLSSSSFLDHHLHCCAQDLLCSRRGQNLGTAAFAYTGWRSLQMRPSTGGQIENSADGGTAQAAS